MWVGIALIACGLLSFLLFTSAPADIIFASTAWTSTASWTLTALPLFIWMGEILFRTRLAEDLFTGLSPWVQRLPGRLIHVNILGCGVFAAVSGSSAATAATIGRISLPELKRRGYPDSLSLGTLAGSGTLGLLIPPSIIMIVYGVAAGVSVARLFLAGILPGLLLMALFSSYVAYRALRNPEIIPLDAQRMGIIERIKLLRLMLPVVLLFIAVIGSIYAGVATPTEAAAFGVAGALLVAWASGSLSAATFWATLTSATSTTCMIALILLGAAFLTSSMSFTGLPRDLALWVSHLGLSQIELLVALTVLFVVLGCFLDGISMVVLSAAIILPTVRAAGIDPVWFGIYLILVVEIAQLTPPVGFNLYVIQGLTGDNILRIARYALPSFLMMILAIVLITVFPQIVLLLPKLAFS
jgi:C4-dicarboxylate transporter, DctM subunit